MKSKILPIYNWKDTRASFGYKPSKFEKSDLQFLLKEFCKEYKGLECKESTSLKIQGQGHQFI